jgi:hypothetical protein
MSLDEILKPLASIKKIREAEIEKLSIDLALKIMEQKKISENSNNPPDVISVNISYLYDKNAEKAVYKVIDKLKEIGVEPDIRADPPKDKIGAQMMLVIKLR